MFHLNPGWVAASVGVIQVLGPGKTGVLPAQKQQKLIEVEHALDPMRLFQQLEQLQQAVFRCAACCSPFVAHIPSAPIRVFSVNYCTAGMLPDERSVPDPAAVFHTLY